MTAPRSMTCPACRFGVAAEATSTPPDYAWCTGAGYALAASHANDAAFPFSMCAVHAATTRDAMAEALDEREKARRS